MWGMDEIYIIEGKNFLASNQPTSCLHVRNLFQLLVCVYLN
jgi:hypothetical protein